MQIHPRGEQVLIEPDSSTVRGGDINRQTAIIIPDTAKEPSRTGTVLAVGPKCFDIKPGDGVLFPRMAGLEFKPAEDRREWQGLRLIKESELLAKVSNGKN